LNPEKLICVFGKYDLGKCWSSL